VLHPHRDAGNAGPSLALFLGRFEGGALVTEDGRRLDEPGVLRAFDGRALHWNEPVTGGTKYSVIFYNRAAGKLHPRAEPRASAARGDPWSADGVRVPM